MLIEEQREIYPTPWVKKFAFLPVNLHMDEQTQKVVQVLFGMYEFRRLNHVEEERRLPGSVLSYVWNRY
jgi:hypothetical protein